MQNVRVKYPQFKYAYFGYKGTYLRSFLLNKAAA